jgi:hypothetical protein
MWGLFEGTNQTHFVGKSLIERKDSTDIYSSALSIVVVNLMVLTDLSSS